MRRVREVAYEAYLIAADLALMLAAVAACRALGHKRPLRWQDMSTGRIGVCTRCATTVVPIEPSR
jgi:hypothetical protein